MKNLKTLVSFLSLLIGYEHAHAQTTPIDNLSAGPHIFAEMKNVHVETFLSDIKIKFDLYLAASDAYVNFVKPAAEGGQGANFGLESVDLAFDIELGSYVNLNGSEYVYGIVSANQSGLQISKIQGLNNVKGNSPSGMDSKFKLSVFRDINSLPLSTTPTKVGQVSVSLPVLSQSEPDASAKLVLRCAQNGFGTGLSGSKWNDFAGHTRNIVGSAAPSKPLPVTLVSFDAKQENSIVSLAWKTTQEINSDHFEVQRSASGRGWKTVQIVQALGENTGEHHYDAVDAAPLAGNNLYRLRMVDQDGTEAFSKIVNVRFEQEADFIYPNPATDRLYFKNQGLEKISAVEISDVSGLSVLKTSRVSKDGIDLKVLKPGLYQVKVSEANAVKSLKLVVVK